MNARAAHRTALTMLLLTNFFWGFSFPLTKAIVFLHQRLVPASGNWFITAMTLAPRFLLGAAFMLAVAWRPTVDATAAERKQGFLLGLSAAIGMVFQIDGLQFISASTSAFLTQLYAILIPLYVAIRARRSPGASVWTACALVLAGVAVLAQFSLREFHIGRGELETLVASLFFMWQILTLERKEFAGNRVMPVTALMFTTEAVVFCAMAVMTAPAPVALVTPWLSGPWLTFTLVLTGLCTIAAFSLMNRFQPAITATEAGLLYCTEPLFASVLALFLPALLSAWAGFDYANETLTWRLLAGGGLITAANLLLQFRPVPKPAAA
ncbi:MAG: DMT family transporter [Opitutae bacterium]|nr:DMT family transporter [Opitutae bacterium]